MCKITSRPNEAEMNLGLQTAPSFRHTPISDDRAHETHCTRFVATVFFNTSNCQLMRNIAVSIIEIRISRLSHLWTIASHFLVYCQQSERGKDLFHALERNLVLWYGFHMPLNLGVENTDTVRYKTQHIRYTHRLTNFETWRTKPV